MSEKTLPPYGPLQPSDWLQSPLLHRAVLALILLNAASMGLQTYREPLDILSAHVGWPLADWLRAFDWAVIFLLLLELAGRVRQQGRSFFREPWNLLDTVATLGSILTLLPALLALRLLHSVTSLRQMTAIVARSLSGCMSVSLLMVVTLFIFALAGHALYGQTHPALFGDLHTAMHALFRVGNFFAIDDVAGQLIQTYPHVYFFLFPYLLLMSFVVLSFFAAIVVFYLEAYSFDDVKQGRIIPIGEAEQESAPAAAPATLLNPERCAALQLQLAGLQQDIRDAKARRAARSRHH